MKHLKITFFLGLILLTIFTACESKEEQEQRITENVKEELQAEKAKKEIEALAQKYENQPILKKVKGVPSLAELMEKRAEFDEKEVSVTGFFDGINESASDENQVSIHLHGGPNTTMIMVEIPKSEWEKESYEALRKIKKTLFKKTT